MNRWLAALLLLVTACASARSLDPEIYELALAVRSDGTTTDSVTLLLTNGNEPGVVPSRPGMLEVLVAVPPETTPVVQLLDVEWDLVAGDSVREAGLGRNDVRLGVAYPSPNGDPRAAYLDRFRSVGVARVSIPFAVQPVLRQGEHAPDKALIAVRRARVHVRFEGPSASLSPSPDPMSFMQVDPMLARVGAAAFVNAEQLDVLSRPTDPVASREQVAAWNELLKRSAARGPLVQARVSRPGLHAVRAADFQRAGADPASVPAEQLRLFMDGREIPGLILGSRRGATMAEVDGIAFYVPPDGMELEPWKSVWLLRDGMPGKESLLRPASGTAPDMATTASLALEHTRTLFQPAVFDHLMPAGGPQRRWATATVDPGKLVHLEFQATGPFLAEGASLRLTSAGRVGSDTSTLEVYLNGTPIGTAATRGIAVHRTEWDIPPGVLRDGTNRVAIRNVPPDDGSPALMATVVQVDVKWKASPLSLLPLEIATHGPLAEPRRVTVSRPRNSPAEIVVAVQPERGLPRIVEARARRSTDGKRLEFAVSLQPSGEQATRVTYGIADSLPSPEEMLAPPVPRSFLATEACDYLVIAWGPHIPAITPLAEYRAAQGYRVEVLPVDDLYNAFGYGNVSYESIRDAIKHTYAERDAPRLAKVLMVGEASETWQERRLRFDMPVGENQVPIFGWRDPSITIHGDDGYARIAGSGPLADVEIGRISARTPEEVSTVVRKIIDYETRLPPGPWMGRHLFVTDDEPEFARAADAVIARTQRGWNWPERLYIQDLPYETYFRIHQRKRSIAATDRIIEAISDGVMTVNYFGHGGPNLWSGERIFHYRDIDAIDHRGRQPLMVVASCDTAWVDYPVEPVISSIGELLQRSAKGGVIALWAPIAGTSSFEHTFLLARFYQHWFGRGITDLGELSLHSKLGYMADRNLASVPEQYILLGDPALRLPTPPAGLDLAVERSHLITVGGGTLAVTGTAKGIGLGSAEVRLLDAERRDAAPPQRARVRAGQFAATLQLPAYLAPGRYELVASAFNESERQLATATRAIEVRDPAIGIAWEADTDTPRRPGEELPFTLRIRNRDTMPVDGVHIRLRDRAAGTDILNQRIRLEAGEELVRTASLAVPEGIRPIDAQIVPAAEAQLAEATAVTSDTLVLRGSGSVEHGLAVPVGGARVANSGDRCEVTVPVFNLAAENSAPLMVRLRDPGTDTQSPRMNLPLLEPNQSADLRFQFPRTLPAGPAELLLEFSAPADPGRILFSVPAKTTVPRGPDLRIVPGSVRTDRTEYVDGSTVFVEAEVENIGDAPVTEARVRLFLGAAGGEDRLIGPMDSIGFQPRIRLPLYPRERAPVRLRWDPQGTFHSTTQTIYVLAEALVPAEDGNRTDNSAPVDVKFIPPPNLALLKDEVVLGNRLILPSDRVRVTVPYANVSEYSFTRDFAVSAYATGPTIPQRRLFREVVPHLDPGERGTIDFVWDARSGETGLYLVINEDREHLETTAADNEVRFDFGYLVAPGFLADRGKPWDFSRVAEQYQLTNVRVAADGSLAIDPESFGDAFETVVKREYLVGGSLPDRADDSERDNSFSLFTDVGHLIQQATEDAAPVRLRIPLPDTGTTLYDVRWEIRGRRKGDKFPSGSFRFRTEDSGEWQIRDSEPSGWTRIGPVETRDNFLDIEVAGSGTPSRNGFYTLRITPVRGTVLAPAVAVEKARRGVLRADANLPPGTELRFAVRYGTGNRSDVRWSEWKGVGEDGAFPAREDASFFQWRAYLFGTRDASPSLRNVTVDWGHKP
jgi:hypothetical protein